VSKTDVFAKLESMTQSRRREWDSDAHRVLITRNLLKTGFAWVSRFAGLPFSPHKIPHRSPAKFSADEPHQTNDKKDEKSSAEE
jgi:hypothetical protein